MTSTPYDETISTPMVEALETAWATIRARHEDVPPAVVILGAGSIGAPKGMLRLGHFASSRWQQGSDGAPHAEIFIGGEGLARGPVDVLGTLLHEAAHAVANARGIKDTSRGGRYHNRRFKELAEELGITVEQAGSIGWSHTSVPEGTEAAYAHTLVELGEALTWFRQAEGMVTIGTGGGGTTGGGADGSGTDGGRRSNNNGVACVCECGRRIRVAPSVLELGPIACGVCGSDFEAPADTESETAAAA